MPINSLHRRGLLVALVVAIATFAIVYGLNEWFHQDFLPSLGLPSPMGDAVGSVLIVMVAYFAQRMVSLAFYRDVMFGLSNEQEQVVSKFSDVETVSEEVARELTNVRNYNDVLRKQLDGIVEATEKAAYDIAERL